MIINSFGDYISWTQECHTKSKGTLFRGQSVEGKLLPSIARSNPKYNSTQLERTILDQFRLLGASILASQSKNQLELLIVAQHFGLKTRLLDWTSNPLVALYFACREKNSKHSFVYALKPETLIARDIYEKDPFALTKTRVFQPPMNNVRILAQHGWFTLHTFSEKLKEFIALENNPDTAELLEVVIISASAKLTILDALSGHGIASHTLFPDLGGLSHYLNTTYSLD